MRGGWSNDEKSRNRGQQNERPKFSTAWLLDFPLRQKWRKAQWQRQSGFDCWKKIIQKPVRIGISFGRHFPDKAVSAARGKPREIRRRERWRCWTKLFLRADFVAVVPIDGWIGRGIGSNFGGGLIELSLRALFFLHFALLNALHFFLPLLKCRGHKPLLTAECGEGPGPCRPAHPWKRKTTSAVRAAGAPTHGNLRSKNGRVRRHPCRVHHPRARVLRSGRQNSSGRVVRRLRPSGALRSLSNCARQLLCHRGRSWLAPLPRHWAFRRMQNRAHGRSPGPWPCERALPGQTGQTARAVRSTMSGSSCC